MSHKPAVVKGADGVWTIYLPNGTCLASSSWAEAMVYLDIRARHFRRPEAVEPEPAPVRRELAPCGTEAAAKRHTRRGERVCERCREARRLAYHERRATA